MFITSFAAHTENSKASQVYCVHHSCCTLEDTVYINRDAKSSEASHNTTYQTRDGYMLYSRTSMSITPNTECITKCVTSPWKCVCFIFLYNGIATTHKRHAAFSVLPLPVNVYLCMSRHYILVCRHHHFSIKGSLNNCVTTFCEYILVSVSSMNVASICALPLYLLAYFL